VAAENIASAGKKRTPKRVKEALKRGGEHSDLTNFSKIGKFLAQVGMKKCGEEMKKKGYLEVDHLFEPHKKTNAEGEKTIPSSRCRKKRKKEL